MNLKLITNAATRPKLSGECFKDAWESVERVTHVTSWLETNFVTAAATQGALDDLFKEPL
jgi:hypothetical protein